MASWGDDSVLFSDILSSSASSVSQRGTQVPDPSMKTKEKGEVSIILDVLVGGSLGRSITNEEKWITHLARAINVH